MIGMAALRLTRDDRDFVRDEADRFLLVLQAAREETILQGNVLTAELRADGYRFLGVSEKGKLVALDEGALAPHKFPPRMEVRLELEGQRAGGTQALVLDPSGTVPAFKVDFSLNAARWTVLAQPNGKMCSTVKDTCEPQ